MRHSKISPPLSVALSSTNDPELLTGFSSATDTWEIILRFWPNRFAELQASFPDITMTQLYGSYAIVQASTEEIFALAEDPLVTYIERASALFYAQDEQSPRSGSCLLPLIGAPNYLDGTGIVCGVIDSGVDVFHPIFQTPEGQTRFIAYWDQTRPGTPPVGYPYGTAFTEADIQEQLFAGGPTPGEMPWDPSGHGTAVAGIIAEIATGCRFIGVRLGRPSPGSTFPMTTQLMLAVNYVYETALALGAALVLNLSFGNSFGAHDGSSLLETYLDEVATLGQSSIVVGTGNEGSAGRHLEVLLTIAQTVSFQVAPFQVGFSLQIWKDYADEIEVTITSPQGFSLPLSLSASEPQAVPLGETTLQYLVADPVPYTLNQLLWITFSPETDYVTDGVWQIQLRPRSIKNGQVRLWLPSGDLVLSATRFLSPTLSGTLTIPSTASRVISVGAYLPQTGSIADFSGRGFLPYNGKPDLVAPGGSILAPVAAQGYPRGQHPNGYAGFTGTSFATPIVSGTCALLMQQGIVQGNDPFLYGEKLKAVLRRNAALLYGEETLPNNQSGYGALCGSGYARQISGVPSNSNIT